VREFAGAAGIAAQHSPSLTAALMFSRSPFGFVQRSL